MAGVILVWPETFDSLFEAESGTGPVADELPDWLAPAINDPNY